jgi:hypothetical protein
LKNRAARVGESSPEFYEDERAREEPGVPQTPPKWEKQSLKGNIQPQYSQFFS